MTQAVAESKLLTWFWMFENKMCKEFPEYSGTFDYIVDKSYDAGVLYEVMEFANRYLEVESELKGGFDNLIITNYLDAIEYGYMEWVK